MPSKTKNKQHHPSLSEMKRPKNDIDHSTFSITKHAAPSHDYGHGRKKRDFERPLVTHEKQLVQEVKEQGFWGALATEIKKEVEEVKANEQGAVAALAPAAPIQAVVKAVTHELVQVQRQPHRRSPYVIKLAKEVKEVLTAPLPQIRREVKPEQKKPTKATARPLLYLRSSADDGVYEPILSGKNLSARKKQHSVNFLNKSKEKFFPTLQSCGHPPLTKGGTRGGGMSAISGWFFDFILTPPLALLFLLQFFLMVIDKATQALVWLGRTLLNFIFFEVLLGAVSLARGLVIVPLKLLTVVFLLLFRFVGLLGLGTVEIIGGIVVFFKTASAALVHPPRFFWRRLAAFSIMVFLLLGAVKFTLDTPGELRSARGRVLGAAAEGISSLRNFSNALQSGDTAAAQDSWQKANLAFSEASNALNSVNVLARTLAALTSQGQSGRRLLSAVSKLSQAGDALGAGLASVFASENDALALIKNFTAALSAAQPHLAASQADLAQVDGKAVPENYRESFRAAVALLPKIQEAILDFNDLSVGLLSALGAEGTKRYAVLFQNNNELRPAGGFIGSLALLDIERGRITKMEIPGGGSYDFNGQLTKHVYSPKPLWLINPHWQVQDANWYPDWPASAEKLMWFLENAGYYSLDGVIAFQASTFSDLLSVLGPIEFTEQNITLTSETVLREMQVAVELKYDKEKNRPKEYIGQLAPRILDKILASHGSEWLEILSLLDREITEKNILLYFRDKGMNEKMAARGWQPRILGSDGDYIAVIHANIGGGKTDGVISEEWRQDVNIGSDGTAVAELTVSREHQGNAEDFFEGATNNDFVRFYVPVGSELLSAAGFTPPPAAAYEQPEEYYRPDEELTRIEGKVLVDEATGTRINNEFGKTVFGNWLRVAPGQKITAKIRYRLPFKIIPPDGWGKDRGGYSLLMQKQAGARPAKFTVTLRYPETWQVAWQKQSGSEQLQPMGPGILEFSGSLSRDTGFAVLFGKKE